jgi:hypothetical protein
MLIESCFCATCGAAMSPYQKFQVGAMSRWVVVVVDLEGLAVLRGHVVAIDDDRLRPVRIDRLRAERRRLEDALDLRPLDGTVGLVVANRPPQTDDLLEFHA